MLANLIAAAKPVEAQDLRARLDELFRNAAAYYQSGQFAAAVPHAERALALAEQVFGKEHKETAKFVNALGEVYRTPNRNEEADRLPSRALTMSEAFTGPTSIGRCMHLSFGDVGQQVAGDLGVEIVIQALRLGLFLEESQCLSQMCGGIGQAALLNVGLAQVQ